VRKNIVKEVSSGKTLDGPPLCFLTGVNPFAYKPTHLHHRLLSYTEKYGDFFQFALIDQMGVSIGDPGLLNEVMSNKNFNLRMYPPFFDRFLKGRGILFTNNLEVWKVSRTAALHGIMKNSHLRQIATWTAASADKLINRLNTTHEGKEFELDIDEDFSKLALDVIAQAAFSVDINAVVEENSPFTKLIRQVMNTVWFMFLPLYMYDLYTPPGMKEGERALESLRDMVRTIMHDRRKANQVGQFNDLLDILLKYQAQEEGGTQLQDEDIVFACWDMFIAGHETTAHTMAWTLDLLAANPRVQQKLLNEIHTELGNETPDFENIKRLGYLHNVIKETLRVRPVVPIFTRLSASEEVLNGHRLAPMTPVVILNSRLHMHPKYWDKPTEFMPERWESIENVESLPYRPFGYGSRQCVGMRMAHIEAKVAIAKMIQAYEIKLPQNPIEAEEELLVTMRPKGMKIKLVQRPSFLPAV